MSVCVCLHVASATLPKSSFFHSKSRDYRTHKQEKTGRKNKEENKTAAAKTIKTEALYKATRKKGKKKKKKISELQFSKAVSINPL